MMSTAVDKIQDLAQRAADIVFNLRSYPEGKPASRPKIVAHRGAWDRQQHVENTLNAFERAQSLGVWAIELDIHFTRDNVPVVHHDADLKRCHSHKGVLCDLKFGELRGAVPAVPSLEEVLALSGLHFMLEVKTALSNEQVLILNRLLGRFKPLQDYHMLTLQPELVRITSAIPEPAWILVGDVNLKSLSKISLNQKLGGVAGHYLFITNDIVRRLHDNSQKAGSGFLPTKNLFNREWNRGVDWVFTNHSAGLLP